MSLYLNNFKNQPPILVIKDEDINGLSEFKKSLEKLFFSQVLICNSSSDGKTVNLVVEIACNFDLNEGISHLDEGIWAQYRKKTEKGFESSHFYHLVKRLQTRNNFAIDIDELSIVFNNCNIVINKIYKNSIPKHLDAILTKFSEHHTLFTLREVEVPYEIFIPVFEESNIAANTDDLIAVNVVSDHNKKTDYFNYWGLYFQTEDDALIYDLKKSTVIGGDLYMLTT
tara:strand:+ start:1688 stop:2368 length:681 start_codon:yes stop_codon:yes gene_type:complete